MPESMNSDEIKAEINRLQALLKEQELAKLEEERLARIEADRIAKEREQSVPDIYADYNKEHTHVVFNLKPNAPAHLFYSNSAIGFNHNYNRYTLNISNLYELKSLIERFNKQYLDRRFALSETLQSDLDKEIANRAKLLAILNDDGSNLLPYKLNEYNLTLEQAKSVEFLKYSDGNGIIALKMGKGKTPTALAYMKWYWDNVDDKQKFMLISPATLRPNWAKEVKKFLGSDEKVYPLSSTTPSSLDVQELVINHNYRIFYANYDLISRGLKTKDNGVERTVFPWVAILNMANLKLIMDEAHYIKSPNAARTQAIHLCKFKSSALLSGTPMKNGPGELYTLVRQLKPDFAGSYQSWINTYTLNNGKIARDATLLRSILEPLMYRPKTYSDDVGLQPINRITIEYELSDNAKKLYNQILLGFYNDLAKWSGSIDSNSQLINNMLVEMMRMKQVCAADKIDFIAERATDTYDSCDEDDPHKKVIIFSQFANEPPIVERIHQRLGSESLMFTGNDSVGDRQRIVDRFQTDDSIHFLCCSTKAASEGLNITAAGHVIFADLLWTPSDHAQAEGRAYNRVSDPHTITSTYVIASDTIEDHIVSILTRKLGEIGKIVDGVDIGNESIVKELLGELKNMRMLK